MSFNPEAHGLIVITTPPNGMQPIPEKSIPPETSSYKGEESHSKKRSSSGSDHCPPWPRMVPAHVVPRRVIFPAYHDKRQGGSDSKPEEAKQQKPSSYQRRKLPSPTPVSQRRPRPKEDGVTHTYRNHLLSFFAPDSCNGSNSNQIRVAHDRINVNERRPVDDICVGTKSTPPVVSKPVPLHYKSQSEQLSDRPRPLPSQLLLKKPTMRNNSKRNSVLPNLPLSPYGASTIESAGRVSTHCTNTCRTSPAKCQCRSKLNDDDNKARLARGTPTPTAKNVLQFEHFESRAPASAALMPTSSSMSESSQQKQAPSPSPSTTPKGYRRIVPIPFLPYTPRVSKSQFDALREKLPLSEQCPQTPSIGTTTTSASSSSSSATTTSPPLKSILRKSKYAPESSATELQKAEVSVRSVPSLVDIKDSSDDDDDDVDDDTSHTSCDHVTTDTANASLALNPAESTISPLSMEPIEEETVDGYPTKNTKADLKNCQDLACQEHKVKFNPRVWVREFHRHPVELSCTWFTNEDMEFFKRLAMERIIRYQSPTEMLATGTGRIVQRALPPWNGPVYSHAALTLDGENVGDAFLRKKVIEKELHSVLVVDPHVLSLKLFKKSLEIALPCTARVTTVTSSKEVFRLLEQGCRFDVIIVEERLQLFRRHGSSSSTSSCDSIVEPETMNGLSATRSSGAALVNILSKNAATSKSLFIGVSAHMLEDEEKMQSCGADFSWNKPPPPINQDLIENLARAILVKRGRTVLAAELFGE